MRRSLVAVIAVVLTFVGAAPIEAQQGTRCRHELEFTVTPGLSMNPSTGTHTGFGSITCDGWSRASSRRAPAR